MKYTENAVLYEFGEFKLDSGLRRLLRNGEPVPVTPKAIDTLLVLVENCGRVVDKQELFNRVWPGIAVEENNLTQNISALRKALGETPDEPRHILTASGQGYRFVGLRVPAPAGASKRTRLIAAIAMLAVAAVAGALGLFWKWRAPGARLDSIAVLPFRPLTQTSADDYLGLGLADALINKLSNIRGITVRPTNAVIRYANSAYDPAEVGRALGVDALLDGRVQRSGDRIRVTVQLIRTRDGAPLWAGKFDEKFTDIFTVEDRVSEQAAHALLPTLTNAQRAQLARHYTENAEAYQAYLEGRYHWNKRTPASLRKAVDCFQRAIGADGSYALAYAGLADAYAALAVFGEPSLEPSQDVFPKAKRAALDALKLDEQLAEAHAALGYVEHRFDWDWDGARAEFERAIELNPGYPAAHQWLGWYWVSLGRFEQSLAEFEKARELDPVSLYVNMNLGMPYFFSRRYDEAIQHYLKVVDLDPDYPLAHHWMGRAREQQEKFAEAEAEFRRAIALSGERPEVATTLGYVYALSGRQKEARLMLERIEEESKKRYVSPTGPAHVYAALGENAKALDWLERCADRRIESLVFLKVEPRFARLRQEPRFIQVVRRVGLQP